jgi:hypothetical protein
MTNTPIQKLDLSKSRDPPIRPQSELSRPANLRPKFDRIERRRNHAALPPEKDESAGWSTRQRYCPYLVRRQGSAGLSAERCRRGAPQTDRSWCAYCRPKTATNIVPLRKRPCGPAGRSNSGAGIRRYGISTAALRHKLPVNILAQGCRDSPASIVQLKSQYRTVRDQASETPHQFRTRNNLIRTQRTRSKLNKNAVKSTKLTDLLPLITVWLQVRVLPGPPVH